MKFQPLFPNYLEVLNYSESMFREDIIEPVFGKADFNPIQDLGEQSEIKNSLHKFTTNSLFAGCGSITISASEVNWIKQ